MVAGTLLQEKKKLPEGAALKSMINDYFVFLSR